MPPDSLRGLGLYPIALDRVLEYLVGNPRIQPAADEYYHAACYGAFAADLTIELRKLMAAAQSITHEGHRFRLAYLRKHRDTQMMHNGGTFAFDVVRERYLRPSIESMHSPDFTELLELYKGRIYDANIASSAKTSARQRFGGSTTAPGTAAVATATTSRTRAQSARRWRHEQAPYLQRTPPRMTLFGKGKAKVEEAPFVDDMSTRDPACALQQLAECRSGL
eukprot:jgi/Tetstr1/439759/TSEL_028173.t1